MRVPTSFVVLAPVVCVSTCAGPDWMCVYPLPLPPSSDAQAGNGVVRTNAAHITVSLCVLLQAS